MCYIQVTHEEILPEEVSEEDKEAEGGHQQTETTRGNTKSPNTSFRQPNSSYARSRQANTPILREALAVMKAVQAKNQMNNRDDCSVFGENVENKIRKLSNPRTQAAVQHVICIALFDAEMGKFNQHPRMYGQPPVQYTIQ